MVWRLTLLLASIFGILVGIVVPRHRQFASGMVAGFSDPEYLVRCEGVDFRADTTVATVRIIDNNHFPQFQAFRESLTSANSVMFLDVPRSYGRRPVRLRFLRFESRPPLLFETKQGNTIHQGVLTIDFQPIGKFRADPLNIDVVFLKFPGFAPFAVKRTDPISQAQGTFTSIENEVIAAVNLQAASACLWLGIFGVSFTSYDSWRHWDLIVYRFKLAQRNLSPRGNLVDGKSKNSRDGVLLPPKWDEKAIGIEFRNLRNHPGILKVFTQSVVDRYVIGQDDKTAQSRIRYLRTKLEEMKLAKEIQSSIDDLEFRETDLEVRRLKLDIEKADLEHKRNMQEELRAAEHKRDLLKVRAETAGYEKQIRDTEPPPARPAPTVSREQEIRDHIQRLWEKRAYAHETIKDEDERRRAENMYDDKIVELEEQLRKVL